MYKQKPSVHWIDFFNLLSKCFTIHFLIHYIGCANNIKYIKMSVIFSMYNFFVIWLWFIVENICDISILMHNLPDCSLKRFYSLILKNPNSLFTPFIYLFLVRYNYNEYKLFVLNNHHIIFFLSLSLSWNHVTFYITIFYTIITHLLRSVGLF